MENRGHRGRWSQRGRGRPRGGRDSRSERTQWRSVERGYDTDEQRRRDLSGNGGGDGGGRSVPGSGPPRGGDDGLWGPVQECGGDRVGERRLPARGRAGGESGGSTSVVDELGSDLGELLQVSSRIVPQQSGERKPIRRPDDGGTLKVKIRKLHVNHFLMNFDPNSVLLHYDIDIKPEVESRGSGKVSKADTMLVKNKFFLEEQLDMWATAYDGQKNVYSAIKLPEGSHKLTLSKGDDVKPQTFILTIKLVKRLELRKLRTYLQRSGFLLPIPRDIFQGLDVIMKENPSRTRIQCGKLFYPKTVGDECDLGKGIIAPRGLKQSLKPTNQGPALCVDYSVNTFWKRVGVLEFLEAYLGISFGNKNISLNESNKGRVEKALRSLKVTVTHRKTNQRYEVKGLTQHVTKNLTFSLADSNVGIMEYFKSRYGKEIYYENLPCLDLSQPKRQNYVPMEYCQLVEGQRFPKEDLDWEQNKKLRGLALARPDERKHHINQLVRANDGPCCHKILEQFKLGIDTNMTEATGRVLKQPNLKIRNENNIETRVTFERNCQWNFVDKKVLDGKTIERWAILDFSSKYSRYGGKSLNLGPFIECLVERCRRIGIYMDPKPQLIEKSRMDILDNPTELRNILERINKKTMGKLQILICPMTDRHLGYKNLKRICETEIGIVTQCCRSFIANKLEDQYLANLALKINAKVGGANMELIDRLPRLDDDCYVMFIGADVNHPTGLDREGPSVAAVTATINWPAANKYAARFRLQKRKTERILDFGQMCLELIEAYARINNVKPEKIIIFRDGVSESQFDMVLNEELTDIKTTICSDGYSPTITLVVAQKRHHTRFFLPNSNVEPGTVVDQKIVHPFEFDFYLCSHHGSLGTSKPTHYHVLWDEHSFTSDQLQQIIYHLCYTFARCTKPVSLVPPVYYADLVAYRGRLYYESWIQSCSPASTGTSSSSPMSSSSDFSSQASFDLNNFPKLRREVENMMYFS